MPVSDSEELPMQKRERERERAGNREGRLRRAAIISGQVQN